MFSIKTDTTYDYADTSWDAAFRKKLKAIGIDEDPEYAVEPKFDGLSVNLRYVGGKLESVSTRGDGYCGDDITTKALLTDTVPIVLNDPTVPFIFEVRGEMFISEEELSTLNADDGATPKRYKNCRNAVAGIVFGSEDLHKKAVLAQIYCYGLGEVSEWPNKPKTQDALVKYFEKLGFFTVTYDAITNIGDVAAARRAYKNFGKIPTDGTVIKLNSLEYQELLGFQGREPNWAIAVKDVPEEVITEVLGFTFQIGKTGRITPVCILEPVDVGGATVSRATLHNARFATDKKLREGDLVSIRRAGDVVPEVVCVEFHNEGGEPFKMPTVCPCCATKLKKDVDAVNYYCPAGMKCDDQRIANMVYVVSRKCLNINHIGKAFLQEMDIGFPSDLYDLTVNGLVEKGISTHMAEKIIASIQKSKGLPLWKFLVAINIRGLGPTYAKLLANTFKTYKAIKGLTKKQLEDAGIPKQVAARIAAIFDKEKADILHYLVDKFYENAEVRDQEEDGVVGPLTGKKVSITGTMKEKTRKEVEEYVESLGGKVPSTGSDFDFLIAGEKPGVKREVAMSLGKKILSEEEFFKKYKKE
jgi:DNA ligase (NAD+)